MIETLKTKFAELQAGTPLPTVGKAHCPEWDDERRMNAVVWNGKENMEFVQEHARPKITHPKDILLRMTATTICGSDLHLYKDTFPGMKRGDIQGHEFMGIVEEVGPEVKTIKLYQRVVVAFGIACGECEYCQRKLFTACDRTNPSRVVANTYGDRPAAFFGYSHLTGGVPGGHADYIRVPFADVNCFPVPEGIPDEKALYLTDVIPTSLHGALMGEVGEGSTVGIWGLGPIGLMCARWCQLLGASRIIGIDVVPDRLALAGRVLGITTLDFAAEEHGGDNSAAIRALNNGRPLDVGIECAGFDYASSWLHKLQAAVGLESDTPEILTQMVRSVRKFGNISILGVYCGTANNFPIGALMEKGITLRGSQCPAQKYMGLCMEKVQSGEIDPSFLVTHRGDLADAPRFFQMMADKKDGCIKVFMRPVERCSEGEGEEQFSRCDGKREGNAHKCEEKEIEGRACQ